MTLLPGTYKIHNFRSKTAMDLNGVDNKSLIGYPPHDGENQRVRYFPLQQTIAEDAFSGLYQSSEGGG